MSSEETEEVSGLKKASTVILSSDRTHICRGQHVLRVHQGPQQAHELHRAAELRVRVTDHVLDDQVDQEDVLQTRLGYQSVEGARVLRVAGNLSGDTHVVVLLGLLHDKFSYHGGVVLHQIGEDICGRPPHLNVIHSLCHQHTYWLLTGILSHH